MAHRRYASPAERIRFGGKWPRYIPPFKSSVPDVPPGGFGQVLLPAGPAAYYIQWTINEDNNGALPQSWGQAQLRNAANTLIYTHQFNDRINASVYYIVNGSVAFSTGIAAQQGDIGVLVWNIAANGLDFEIYRAGALIPGASYHLNGVPVFDHVLFAAGVSPISRIIVRNSIPASPPL